MYPQRVMTRRRRLRTRTLVLLLAATLGGIVALPVHGAPDPLSQALRSWDVLIGDGRSGQALPQQVIIVLAAPPAVSVESSDASKIALASQQLDLDAIDRAGIWMSIQYHFVNALNAVAATVRPDQIAQLRAAPEVAGVYPVRRLYPAAIASTRCCIRTCTTSRPPGTRSPASRRPTRPTPRRPRTPRRWPGSSPGAVVRAVCTASRPRRR